MILLRALWHIVLLFSEGLIDKAGQNVADWAHEKWTEASDD